MLHTYSESIDSFGDKAYRVSLGSEVGKGVDKSLTLEATQRKCGWRSLSKKGHGVVLEVGGEAGQKSWIHCFHDNVHVIGRAGSVEKWNEQKLAET